jgi:hypothetical protein
MNRWNSDREREDDNWKRAHGASVRKMQTVPLPPIGA